MIYQHKTLPNKIKCVFSAQSTGTGGGENVIVRLDHRLNTRDERAQVIQGLSTKQHIFGRGIWAGPGGIVW